MTKVSACTVNNNSQADNQQAKTGELPLGLLFTHNSKNKDIAKANIFADPLPKSKESPFNITWAKNGNLVKLARMSTKVGKGEFDRDFGFGGGKRGQVKANISKASRVRLLRECAMINRKKIPSRQALFLTLTYDASEAHRAYTWPDYKKHLNNFLTQLRQQFGGKIFGFWRVEWQVKRFIKYGHAMGHFHVLIFFKQGTKARIDKGWLSTTWNKITQGSEAHLRAGTQVKRVKNWDHLAGYFSKTIAYLGKAEGEQAPELEKMALGRHWGKINAEVISEHQQMEEAPLSRWGFNKMRRVMLRWYKSKRKAGNYFKSSAWRAYKKRVCCWGQTMYLFMSDALMNRMMEACYV
jgi:hypothetical protein